MLQAATQHVLNVADLVNGTVTEQTIAVSSLDTECKSLLKVCKLPLSVCSKGHYRKSNPGLTVQNMLSTQAATEAQHLSALQTPVLFKRLPKAYNPAGIAVWQHTPFHTVQHGSLQCTTSSWVEICMHTMPCRHANSLDKANSRMSCCIPPVTVA